MCAAEKALQDVMLQRTFFLASDGGILAADLAGRSALSVES